MLERIRSDYRSPSATGDARRGLQVHVELTGGKYRRVWTPLANDILLVENAEGESLPVDVLAAGPANSSS